MSKFILGDCMDPETGIPSYPDNYFDLAIVDPPYGIGAENHGGSKKNGWTQWPRKQWDKEIPNNNYWIELFRVSKNQIVCGGNYMTEYLPARMGWIVWDKGQREFSLADGELLWTSFNKALRIFTHSRSKAIYEGKIHPTQKPIALYKWILANYAKPGDLILDTHVGSASSLIAYEQEGFEYVGYELDPDYYAAATKRMKQVLSQTRLF